MSKQYSVFMPIHNEKKFLKFSIPSVYALNADKYIFFFDRCDKETIKETIKFISIFDPTSRKTKAIFNFEKNPEFKFQIAFVKSQALKICKTRYILFVDADMLIDYKKISCDIRTTITRKCIDIKMICWDRKDYPTNIGFELRKLFYKKITRNTSTGLNFVDRIALNKIINIEKLKQIPIALDTFFLVTIKTKHSTMLCNSKSIHLNPKESKTRNEKIGAFLWIELKRNIFHVILSSVIGLRLSVLRGYIHAKHS